MTKEDKTQCYRCQSNDTMSLEYAETITMRDNSGTKFDVVLVSTMCNSCHREFIPTHQILENEKRIKEAKNEL